MWCSKFLVSLCKSQMHVQYKFQLSEMNFIRVLHPTMPKNEVSLKNLCVFGHLFVFFLIFKILDEWWDWITPCLKISWGFVIIRDTLMRFLGQKWPFLAQKTGFHCNVSKCTTFEPQDHCSCIHNCVVNPYKKFFDRSIKNKS